MICLPQPMRRLNEHSLSIGVDSFSIAPKFWPIFNSWSANSLSSLFPLAPAVGKRGEKKIKNNKLNAEIYSHSF